MAKWFSAKRVGFGYTPTSVVGWVLTLALLGLLWGLWKATQSTHGAPSLLFVGGAAVLVIGYFVIAKVFSGGD